MYTLIIVILITPMMRSGIAVTSQSIPNFQDKSSCEEVLKTLPDEVRKNSFCVKDSSTVNGQLFRDRSE